MNTIEQLLAELAAGRMVVVMDDEDRENEGDLLMVASCVRPEDVNFMARYGRGLICLTLTRQRCRELRLPLMVTGDGDHHGTSFTVSIGPRGRDHRDLGTTAHTIRTAVASEPVPTICASGHVSADGAARRRADPAGHTEAGATRRARRPRAGGSLVEILNEDGTMARRRTSSALRPSGLVGTIADLIRYRLHAEAR